MKRIAIAVVVVIGLGVAAMASPAQAAGTIGLHISSGGVHVDVGRAYPGGYGVVAPSYYGGYYNSGYVWIPSTYIRYGHHLQYVPGHWELRRPRHYHHGHHGLH